MSEKLYLVLALVTFLLGTGWVTWVAWMLHEHDASMKRLRTSEHRQSNLIHVLLNLDLKIARKLGIDIKPVEQALIDSGESL